MDQDAVLAAAEEILTRRYGGTQKLSGAAPLSGTGFADVYRARVATNPFLQYRTVVVKHSPELGFALDDAALLREVVAYQFTTALPAAVRPGPVLLGYDLDARIIILSDSGDGDTLASLLERAGEDEYTQILRSLGSALGRMHAGTAGKEEQFDTLFHRLAGQRPGAEGIQRLRDRLLAHRIRLGLVMLKQAGIEVPTEVGVTAANIQSRLLRGGVRAFTPFDLSPDNVIAADGDLHFLDYEWAGFRDATFDAAFVVAGFPLYISPRPYDDVAVQAFLDAWLREVKPAWPLLANEDTLQARITSAMIGWALSSIAVNNPAATAELAAGDEVLAEEFAAAGLDVEFEVEEPADEVTGDLLRRAGERPFSASEEMVREDLRETFNALAAYAGTGTDPAYVVIADFASRVAGRLG